MENKIKRLEDRVAELEKDVAHLKGLDLLTETQLKYIAEYFSEYEIDGVRIEDGKIVVDFVEYDGCIIDYELDEIKNYIDEDTCFYLHDLLHDLIDYKRFDFDEIARALNNYRNFLETWDAK